MILAIVGPTGVGKTKLSIALAKRYHGEIINADAMQVYKGMDIGTAKVTEEEMEGISHHLFSICDCTRNYTVYDYQRDAREKIKEIQSRGHVPIFVGGTGLYLKAALYDYSFPFEEKKDYSAYSLEQINEKIARFHVEVSYDMKNRRRAERVLQKLENGCEMPMTSSLLYEDVLFLGLFMDREKLYRLTDERFLKMVPGLLEENKKLLAYFPKSKALQTAIGYKEFWPYFQNKASLEACCEMAMKNTRHYVKRQYTWFSHQLPVSWIEVSTPFTKTVQDAIHFIEKSRKSS